MQHWKKKNFETAATCFKNLRLINRAQAKRKNRKDF
jgi:hypothetical protein